MEGLAKKYKKTRDTPGLRFLVTSVRSDSGVQ